LAFGLALQQQMLLWVGITTADVALGWPNNSSFRHTEELRGVEFGSANLLFPITIDDVSDRGGSVA
jgi:hypothetical protein